MAFAADGRHLYNRYRSSLAGNKVLQDILDIALNGLPGDESISLVVMHVLIITVL